jgi:hypothetical protein
MRLEIPERVESVNNFLGSAMTGIGSHTGIPSQGLGRLLRALVDLGVFQEDNEGRFANNEVSNHLRSTAPFSLRDMTIVLNDDAVLRGWLQLNLVLQTGTPAFPSVNGSTFFEHLASDQKRSRFLEGLEDLVVITNTRFATASAM